MMKAEEGMFWVETRSEQMVNGGDFCAQHSRHFSSDSRCALAAETFLKLRRDFLSSSPPFSYNLSSLIALQKTVASGLRREKRVKDNSGDAVMNCAFYHCFVLHSHSSCFHLLKKMNKNLRGRAGENCCTKNS